MSTCLALKYHLIKDPLTILSQSDIYNKYHFVQVFPVLIFRRSIPIYITTCHPAPCKIFLISFPPSYTAADDFSLCRGQICILLWGCILVHLHILCGRIPVNSLPTDIHNLILQWVLRKIHKGRISRRIFAHDRNQGIYEYRWGFLNTLLYYVSTHNYPLYEVFLYKMYVNVQKCSLKNVLIQNSRKLKPEYDFSVVLSSKNTQ